MSTIAPEDSPKAKPDALPAHALWVELVTRITTQHLHFRSGDEETAAESVFKIFAIARGLLEKNPAAHAFEELTLKLLNDTLRPYTARWHGWMTEDKALHSADGRPLLKFKDAWVRQQFRRELLELQPRIRGFQEALAALKDGETPDPEWTKNPLSSAMAKVMRDKVAGTGAGHAPEAGKARPGAELGADLTAGIQKQVVMQLPVVSEGLLQTLRLWACRTAATLNEVVVDTLLYCVQRAEKGLVKLTPGQWLKKVMQRCVQWCADKIRRRKEAAINANADRQHVQDLQTAANKMTADASIEIINQCEQDELHKRRRALSLPGAVADAVPPPKLMNACGLALSGGGIRSATFCLGITQVLARRRLLPGFDYLSTVSGGGYLGAFLSAYLGTGANETKNNDAAEEVEARLKETFHVPDKAEAAPAQAAAAPALDGAIQAAAPASIPAPATQPEADTHEPRALRHLRNRSRYLLDGEFWDRLTSICMVLAGGLFNLLIVLPVPLVAALLTYFLYQTPLLKVKGAAPGVASWLPLWNAPLSILLWIALSVLSLIVLLFPRVKKLSLKEVRIDDKSRGLEHWNTCFKWMLIVTGIFLAGWLVPAGFHFYHEVSHLKVPEWLRQGFAVKSGDAWLIALGAVVTTVLTTYASRHPRKARSLGWLMNAGLLVGPLLYLLVYFGVGYRMIFMPVAEGGWHWCCVLVVTVLLLAWAWFLVDVNTYSPHGYYRDRLCECYLQSRAEADKKLEPNRNTVPITRPRLRLTELGTCMAAPYHLINATLNLPSSKDLELRGRNGDFFLFSKHYCGSPLAGYHRTEELEAADPHLDLGTAMAISGAAISSNMGWQTFNNMRLVMTLANVRLGYWLRHPALGVDEATGLHSPGPSYLMREMFAKGMDEKQPYLNLSDGGHIENLAAYELLRRRCKFIVCVDGGQEPDMQCVDLTRLERYAAIDLGIKFHYDLTDLMLQSNGYSRAYGVLVKIDYDPPPNESVRRERDPSTAQWGWMLYLKLAMVGYGPGYVMDYHRQHPIFPHQSTGDQVYDEAQFEAYRALGEAAAESFFVPELTGPGPLQDIESWFQALATTLLPDNDEAFRQEG